MPLSRTMEQGHGRRAEGTVQAERHLGAAWPPPDRRSRARARTLQSGHRQQAWRMRPCRPQNPERVTWRPNGDSRHRHVAQDPAAGAVRDHAGQPGRPAGVDHAAGLTAEDFLFPSRLHDSPHLGTRLYARILGHWVDELGLDPADYGTHSMRRTKATMIPAHQEPTRRAVAPRTHQAELSPEPAYVPSCRHPPRCKWPRCRT